MWSLGCVTTTLLTGNTPFSFVRIRGSDPDNASDMVRAVASTGNLDSLVASPEWQAISDRPKDFIRKLLVLDEDGRMTAEQAIGHHWLTNGHVRQAFDAAYKKAVSGWMGQPLSVDAIEGIPGFYNSPKVSQHQHAEL